VSEYDFSLPLVEPGRRLRAAFVGLGSNGETALRMIQEDALGWFPIEIVGVADIDPEAPGLRYAREIGVGLITADYRELFHLPDLDMIVELTGSDEVRDEIERTRPRHVKLIDHFGAQLFGQLHRAEEAYIRQRAEMRKRTEAHNRRIALILDNIPYEVLVLDTDMVIQHANAAFLRENGYSIEDVRGRSCREVEQGVRGKCDPADCPFSQVMSEKRPVSLVRKHFDREGNLRFSSIVVAPLLASDGTLTGVVEMMRDITERTVLMQEREAATVRIQQFMELAPLATYIKDGEGRYLEVNPATCSLFGRSKEEILGRTDVDILPPEAAASMRTGDRDVFERGEVIRLDEELEIGKRGIFLSTVKYPIKDADGRVTAVCGLSEDVTAQKRAEEDLKRTREYLQNIMDNSPVMIVTADTQGRVVAFNRTAETTLGYTIEEVVGKPARELYLDADERKTLMRLLKSDGCVQDYSVTLKRKDGRELPVSMNIAELKDSAGNTIGTVAASRDISHRKALMDQIIQSERLAAVGRLAAGVAHEINNPLAAINEIAGYLQDLIGGGPGSDEASLMEELEIGVPKILAQVKRCRDITHRLLRFSRKSKATVEVANVNEALDEIVDFLQKEARMARIEIHKQYQPDLPQVTIEEIQLEEIFINLIKNAVQALAEQGRGNIWLTSQEQDGKVSVTVRDDGPGIAEQVRDRLFDPFVTTKKPGQGTGLGLSICYGIIKRYDGEIRVESQPGRGTTFEVILPVHKLSQE
jgi:PAS domain S-box-containing protein